MKSWGVQTVEWKGLNEKDHYSVSFQTQELLGSYAGNVEAVNSKCADLLCCVKVFTARLERTALQM
jgi:hypothetical protein